jgi:hypothetical protein
VERVSLVQRRVEELEGGKKGRTGRTFAKMLVFPAPDDPTRTMVCSRSAFVVSHKR